LTNYLLNEKTHYKRQIETFVNTIDNTILMHVQIHKEKYIRHSQNSLHV